MKMILVITMTLTITKVLELPSPPLFSCYEFCVPPRAAQAPLRMD
jgi:hypothetical protein